jgi:hypothetical protein
MASTTMSATTVESTTTAAVESATTTVESAPTTTVEAATTTRLEVSASTPAAKPASALRSEAPAVREPSAIEAPAIEAPSIKAAAIKSRAIKSPAIKSPVKESTITEATPEAPAVPGSDSDEHAVHEVIRSPIAVWGARVRCVIIVAIRASRRAVGVTTVISTAYPDSYRNLCMRITRCKHANCQ